MRKVLDFIRSIPSITSGIIALLAYGAMQTEEERLQDYMDEYGEDEGCRLYKREGGRL